MTPSLADYVRENAPARAYYETLFPDVRWPSSGSEARVPCVFHNDSKTPSLSLNPDNGKWFCHACEAGGSSIVSFEAKLKGVSVREAAPELYRRYIHPVIPTDQIKAWHKRLLETPSALGYLARERFLAPEIIAEHLLGWNGTRIVIPVFNEFDLCVNAKLYDPLWEKRKTPKMVNYRSRDDQREYGSPVMLYPLKVVANADRIQVEEGEFKTLFALSQGIPTVTTTGGSKTWPSQYNELFRGKHVVLGGDNDQPGEKYRSHVTTNLSKLVASLSTRTLTPADTGKDAPDWYKNDPKARAPGFFKQLIDNPQQVMLENAPEIYERATSQLLSLDQASKAEWYARRIKVPAIVAGKGTAPYMLPKRVRMTCDRSCDTCPLADSTKPFREVKIDPTHPDTLDLIDVSKQVLRKRLLSQGGLGDKPECKSKVDVVEAFNVEELVLIPTLDSSNGQYVTRTAFYVGHGITSNRSYEFEGATVPNPKDQHATHFFDRAKPVQDEIDTFHLTPDLVEKLKVFRPRNLSISAHLYAIAEWQSRNITKIRERPDLHVAVDLAFHSVGSFEFSGELVSRAMLDILVIGDTRCGKGYVTEGLAKYYRVGEVASGENCTFAGLVGGVQQVGKRWFVTWGIIPLNHGRLVVIDEASSLSEQDFSHLSRVRSEGVAEINKIVRESTRASARLIWLSNPRSGRSIRQYNSGVQAVKELVGANEDIARFDFALTVATDEVPSEVINAEHDDAGDAPLYPADLCRALVLWAWSRRPDQIKFSHAAIQETIQSAITFGKTYSPSIPLVQGENIRIKIAKISAAIAARVFSSDDKGELLIVNEHHVRAACQFLRQIYSKPSMAYDTFSDRVSRRTTIEKMGPIDELFNKLSGDRESAINGLRDLYRITADNLSDYVGDVQSARALLGELVKLNCLERNDTYYSKNPAFRSWLNDKTTGPITFTKGVNGNGHHKVSKPTPALRRSAETD